MDIYELLCHIKCNLPPNDFESLRQQFHNNVNDPSTSYFDQISNILSRSNRMSDQVEMFIDFVVTDPNYATEVSRVSEQFDLLQQVELLVSPTNFASFVDCFEFGRLELDVTSPTVIANLAQWQQHQDETLETLLEHHFGHHIDTNNNVMEEFQQQTSSYPTAQQFAPGMENLMQEAYTALHHDPVLCQQFIDILDSDQIEGRAFADSIMNIYQWIQSIDLDLWYPLATVLEQMQTLQESASNQYESYEDFVQKNFLDDDGQEYLDGEIEQARVQHLFSNMSM